MKKGLLVFIIINCLATLAQTNLVKNGNFEEYSTSLLCPFSNRCCNSTSIGNIGGGTDAILKEWDRLPNQTSTPDYFNSCFVGNGDGSCQGPAVGVPMNSFGFQNTY